MKASKAKSRKQDTKAAQKARYLIGHAVAAEKAAEAARNEAKLAKAAYKTARKAFKQARKTAKRARKEAAAAAQAVQAKAKTKPKARKATGKARTKRALPASGRRPAPVASAALAKPPTPSVQPGTAPLAGALPPAGPG